ncbi:MAG: hypothetical protein HY584_03395 [Candidatus Omnitrophica bacterium]|nr:hypothetical protein [Candidatus Omnitrophota bacterium]
MVKAKTGFNRDRLLTAAIYVFLIAALGTYFLPIVGVTLPAFGKKTWSVRDVVSAVPKGAAEKEEKGKKLTPDYDFLDIVKEISPKEPETKATSKISPEFILGALVPVALALAYVLSVLGLFVAFLRKGAVFFSVSALSAVCSVYALLGVFYLGQAAQRAFSDSLAKVEDSPFSMIAKNFVQQVTIQPENGLYALVLLTVIVFGLGVYRKNAAL